MATLQLVGMLDSPYVRRVAVALQLLDLPFEHRSVSVFRGYAQFEAINPVVKAPTLVCDDGTVLMDSTLIIDYAQLLAGPRRSLMPADMAPRRHALRVLGLALAACEKSVQIVYENNTRPPEKRHPPWRDRVGGQLRAACGALETELAARPLPSTSATLDLAGLTTAVVWYFIQRATPAAAPAAACPRLQAYSAEVERLPEFIAAPHGEGVYRQP